MVTGTVVAGGSREYSNHKGVARVYTYAGSAWGQTGADIVGDQDDEHSASQIRLSTNGDVITIGSPYHNNNGHDYAGRQRTFDNVSGTWTLFGGDIEGSYANGSGNELGFDVAMNQTGTMVVAGEPYVYGMNGKPGVQGWPGGMVVHERESTSNPATGIACLDYVSVTGMVVTANTTDITVKPGPCGTQPFTWTWTAPTATPQGVIPTGMANNPYFLNDVICGTYRLDIVDDNGCTDFEVILIPCAGNISNTITVTSDDDCSGECTGAAESDTTSWPVGASYLWTTDAAYTIPVTGGVGSTSYNITSQCPGRYYLRVTLDNGCIWEGSCVIGGGASNITLAAVVTDADMCDDCCGEIDLTVSGTGTAPYTYQWDDPASSTTEDLTCVPPGVYTVIVTDANGCQETDTYTVGISNQQIAFSLTFNGGTGQVDVVSFAGGTPIYTYQWTLNGVAFSNGTTASSTIPSLTPSGNGIYCLTVTDTLKCEVTSCIDVNTRSTSRRYDCTPVTDDCTIVQRCQDLVGHQNGEQSGHSNDVSGNKTTVAVGSPKYNTSGEEPQDLAEIRARRSSTKPKQSKQNRGSVRVYREDTAYKDCWKQIGQTLLGDRAFDEFGHSVSLSNDGNVLAVGAWKHDVEGNADAGRVYIYDYDSTNDTWIARRYISGTAIEEYCGSWVSLSADGAKIALGSIGHKETGTSSGNPVIVGRARMYSYSSPSWTQMGSDIDGHSGIVSGTPVIAFASQLSAVAFSNDGTTVIVGLLNHGIPPAVNGLARVYRFASSAWTQLGSDLFLGNSSPLIHNVEDMGTSVSISTDGNIVAVSGPKSSSDLTTHNDQGITVVYQYASGAWTQLGDNIWGDDAYDKLGFGFGTYLSGDGQSIIVGAIGHNNNKGYARVYKLVSGTWVAVCDTLTGHQPKEFYGHSVSMSTDGSRVSVGGPYFSDTLFNSVGIVEVFDITYGGGNTSAELVTDGVDFTNLNANTHVGEPYTSNAIATLNALSLTAGQWYTFGPDGTAGFYPLAPTPTPSGGEFSLTKGSGIAQKITGLTVGQTYEIKVVTGASICVEPGNIAVYVGSNQGTITPYNGAAANQHKVDAPQTGMPTLYTATATHATIVIWDLRNSETYLPGYNGGTWCEWPIKNISMKAQQTICVECDTSIDPNCGYATLPKCLEACDPSETFNCVEGRCIDPGDGTGAFATKQLCLDDGCEVRKQRWNCKTGVGCLSTYGPGTYSSFSACQTACGVSGEDHDKYYCEILCPGANEAKKYTDDKRTEERKVDGKKYKARVQEDITGGGRCRVVLGTESPAIAAALQYDSEKACLEKCPWCKDETKYGL